MKNAECNGGPSPADIRAHDGKLWLPSPDGVAVIDPGRVTVNLHPPPVAIESILVDHEYWDQISQHAADISMIGIRSTTIVEEIDSLIDQLPED